MKGIYVKACMIALLFVLISAVPLISGSTSLQEPPITSIYFDGATGMVTLVAVDYGYPEPVGVGETYYIVDSGEQQTYEEPFQLPEGTHTIEYWSVDKNDNVERHKTATFTFDITPPSVTITSPAEGNLYLFGYSVMDRMFNDETLCIGQVPVEVDANDGEGVGVKNVFFMYDDDSSFDDNSTDGWSDSYANMHFGNLTITVTAVDGKGLMSEPTEMTIRVYCLGLF